MRRSSRSDKRCSWRLRTQQIWMNIQTENKCFHFHGYVDKANSTMLYYATWTLLDMWSTFQIGNINAWRKANIVVTLPWAVFSNTAMYILWNWDHYYICDMIYMARPRPSAWYPKPYHARYLQKITTKFEIGINIHGMYILNDRKSLILFFHQNKTDVFCYISNMQCVKKAAKYH